MAPRRLLEVQIDGVAAELASVDARLDTGGPWHAADGFDPVRRCHTFRRVPEGRVTVRFFAAGFRAASRRVTIGAGTVRIKFVAVPDDPEIEVLPRGGVNLPFRRRPGALGVFGGREALEALARRHPDIIVRQGDDGQFDLELPEEKRAAAVGLLREAGVLAGPWIADGVILTHRAFVQLEVSAHLADVVARNDVRGTVTWVEPTPGLFLVEFAVDVLEDAAEATLRLAADPGVVFAECALGFLGSTLTLPTTLDPNLWGRHRVKTLEAWGALGASTGSGVVVGVVDRQFLEPTDPAYPNSKFATEFDTRYLGRRDAGTKPVGSDAHGLSCLAVIAARVGSPPIVGIAPESKVFGQLFGVGDVEQADAVQAAAGVVADAPTPAADVLCASMTFAPVFVGTTAYASGAALAAARAIGLRGRAGRGTPFFVAAGNKPGPVATHQPLCAESPFAWGCGAISAGEVRVPNSCTGKGLEWCAPSGDDGQSGIWSYSVEDAANWPESLTPGVAITGVGQYNVLTATPVTVTRDDVVVLVLSSISPTPLGTSFLEHLWNNQSMVIAREGVSSNTDPGPPVQHWVSVTGVLSGLSGFVGGTLYVGRGQIRSNFGDTSAANALASGIGALVLAADSRLTSIEVREILRRTADSRPSIVASKPTIPSYNEDDFGAGRLNAKDAVNLAIHDVHFPFGEVGFYGRHRAKLVKLEVQAQGTVISVIDSTHENVRLLARVAMPTKHANLQLWVRFYIGSALVDSTFAFPARWTPGTGAPAIEDWTSANIVFVGEVEVPAGDISGLGYLDVSVPLPPALYPPSSILPHALVELAPYHHIVKSAPSDGLLASPFTISPSLAVRQVFMMWNADELLESSAHPGMLRFRVKITSASLVSSHPTLSAVARRLDGTTVSVAVTVTAQKVVREHARTVEANVTVSAQHEWVELRSTHSGVTVTHRVEVDAPSDVMLVVDYSGSMNAGTGGVSKWQAAEAAVDLFTILHGVLKPSSQHELGALLFHSIGSAGPYSGTKEWAVSSTRESLADFSCWPGPPSSNHYTPITDGLVRAKALLGALQAGTVRRRHLVLLSDGKENAGTLDLADLATNHATHLPNRIDDPTGGFDLHPVVLGSVGLSHHATLSALVQDEVPSPDPNKYFGRFRWATALGDLTEARALLVHFADIVGDLTRAERVDAVGHWLWVEPGVTRAVFVGLELGMTVTDPSGKHYTTTPAGAAFSWVAVGAAAVPTPGLWRVSTAQPAFAMLDLQLRTRFGVVEGRIESGERATFFAEVHDGGRPVNGADIRVTIDAPTESLGQVLVDRMRAGPPQLERAAVRRWGLRGALAKALVGDAPLASRAVEIKLHEVEPGRYEGTWAGTPESGTISARFVAWGVTPDGANWRRNARRDYHAAAIPDARKSAVRWQLVGASWRAVVEPRTRTGRAVGPGAKLQLFTSARAKRALRVVDLGNGEYQVRVATRGRAKVPRIELGGVGGRAPVATVDQT